MKRKSNIKRELYKIEGNVIGENGELCKGDYPS
jgi:hypothetical protein